MLKITRYGGPNRLLIQSKPRASPIKSLSFPSHKHMYPKKGCMTYVLHPAPRTAVPFIRMAVARDGIPCLTKRLNRTSKPKDTGRQQGTRRPQDTGRQQHAAADRRLAPPKGSAP